MFNDVITCLRYIFTLPYKKEKQNYVSYHYTALTSY
jgi:hypothetical protein